MAFEKYTAPPPPPPKPKPHVRFVRTVIQFTEDGLAHLGDIATKLKDASHVHLWHDKEGSQIAITPAPAGDPDAFPVKDGKIQAKKFFEFAHISWPVKSHGKTLEPHEEGVKLSVNAPAPASRMLRTATVSSKPTRTRKTPDPNRPGYNTDGTKRGGRPKAGH